MQERLVNLANLPKSVAVVISLALAGPTTMLQGKKWDFLSKQSHISRKDNHLPTIDMLLNNNYHAVHHDLPHIPWFALRGVYEASRHQYIERSGGFLVKGYCEWLRLFTFVPVAHPAHDSLSDLIQRNPPASASFAGKLRVKFMVVIPPSHDSSH